MLSYVYITFYFINTYNFLVSAAYGAKQCCGSGSTCFWASRNRIHLSEVWIRIRILLSSCKNSKKTLIPTILWLFLTFSFEKWCKCTFKKYKQKKLCEKTSFLLASWRSMTKIAGSGGSESGSISQRHGSPDPDPPQNVMDPQNWCKVNWRSAEFLKVCLLFKQWARNPSKKASRRLLLC